MARAVRDRHGPGCRGRLRRCWPAPTPRSALDRRGVRAGRHPATGSGAASALLERPARCARRSTCCAASRRALSARLPDLEALAADATTDDGAAAARSPTRSPPPARPKAPGRRGRRPGAGRPVRPRPPAPRCPASAAGFVAWLVATLQAEGAEATRATRSTVATFHAAKGLEWPVVHLAGLEDGLVPIAHARTREQRSEEAPPAVRRHDPGRGRAALHLGRASGRFGGKAGRPPAHALARRRWPSAARPRSARRRRPAGDWRSPPGRAAGRAGRGGAAPPCRRPRRAGRRCTPGATSARPRRAGRARRACCDDHLLEAIAERRPGHARPSWPPCRAWVGSWPPGWATACWRRSPQSSPPPSPPDAPEPPWTSRSSQRSRAGPTRWRRAYAAPELYERLVGLPKLGTPEVLDHEVDGRPRPPADPVPVRRRAVARGHGGGRPAPSSAGSSTRPTTWPPDRSRYRLDPDHYADRIPSSGSCQRRPHRRRLPRAP